MWDDRTDHDRPRVLLEQSRYAHRQAEAEDDEADAWAYGDWEGDLEEEALSEDRNDPPHSDDVLVDEVLAKVHSHGFHRLTPAERAVLQRASRRYRRRRGED